MNSRDLILSKVRSSMIPFPGAELPTLPPVEECRDLDSGMLKKIFQESLTALTGKCLFARDTKEASEILMKLASENGWERFSSTRHPLLSELFPRDFFHGKGKKRLYLGEPEGETDKARLADIPVSIVFPEYFIAETGTCAVLNQTAHERMNCYLTPACVLVGKVSQLHERLQEVWDGIMKNSENPAMRGEYVLVTGPSRTADIERVSVLGVHGPKNVYVILIQD